MTPSISNRPRPGSGLSRPANPPGLGGIGEIKRRYFRSAGLTAADARRDRTIISEAAETQCGLDVLAALGSSESVHAHGLTVSRIAVITGRSRGPLARVLQELVEIGLVDREHDSRRFRLGWGLYVGASLVVEHRLRRWGQRVLDRVAATTGESAYIIIRRGTDAVTVAQATPSRAVHVVSWVGRSYPLVASAAAPVLLSDLSRELVMDLLEGEPLPEGGANSPRSVEDVADLVDTARARRAIVLEEVADPGVTSVVAGIRDFRATVAAAFVVEGPVDRVQDELPDLSQVVAAAADELSIANGFAAGPSAATDIAR